MSGASQDWIFIAVFFGAFIAVTIGEIYWLISSLNVPMKKALTIVFLSNFVTITIGFFVTFIIFGLVLALTGYNDEDTAAPGTLTSIAFIAALAFPFLLMAAIRRLLIGGMRIEQISRPLPYAIISTLVFFAAVLILPVLLLTALR